MLWPAHVRGAVVEQLAVRDEIAARFVIVLPPGNVTTPGIDLVSFDPVLGRLRVIDGKSSLRNSFKANQAKLDAKVANCATGPAGPWCAELKAAIDVFPTSIAGSVPGKTMQEQMLDAYLASDIDARFFKWQWNVGKK